MIIECVNCNKKFNVNPELIPENGRLVKCGYCNHNWHFKKDSSLKKTTAINNQITKKDLLSNNNQIEQNKTISITKTDKLLVNPVTNKDKNKEVNLNHTKKNSIIKKNNFFHI